MKVVAISDTHGQHGQLQHPEGDMLIHAGDVSSMGREGEVKKFLDWFGAQPFRHRVFIAGNHDYLFENEPQQAALLIPDNVIYLNDSGITIEGIKIWGSPVQPWFLDWAFNRQRGAAIKAHWDLIPADTDILVTHGPPMGIRDRLHNGEHAGCEALLDAVQEVNPRYHIFGHIHEGYGISEMGNTTYINASVLNRNYQLANSPVVFEV